MNFCEKKQKTKGEVTAAGQLVCVGYKKIALLFPLCLLLLLLILSLSGERLGSCLLLVVAPLAAIQRTTVRTGADTLSKHQLERRNCLSDDSVSCRYCCVVTVVTPVSKIWEKLPQEHKIEMSTS